MKLWTHHPGNFQLDAAELRIDPAKGEYWKTCDSEFRYRTVLPVLQRRLGSDQLLWCCTTRGRYMPTSEPSDCVEWEIDLPIASACLYSVPVWEDIVWSRTDSWDSLFIVGLTESEAANKNVGALVQLPLPEGCLTCLGQLPPRYLQGSVENPAFRRHLESIGINYFDYLAER